ncbi:MAG: hypothetical protein Q9167_004121 [Letrouitia subvulpina]
MGQVSQLVIDTIRDIPSLPPHLLLAFGLFTCLLLFQILYIFVFILAPIPRDVLRSETFYTTVEADGSVSKPKPLPNWKQKFDEDRELAQQRRLRQQEQEKYNGNNGDPLTYQQPEIGPAELAISLVIPAFNEEERLGKMLGETVEYLEREYGSNSSSPSLSFSSTSIARNNDSHKRKTPNDSTAVAPATNAANGHPPSPSPSHSQEPQGYEILIVSDGSTDRTIDTALDFARSYSNISNNQQQKGQLSGSIRVVPLVENRGKGGAVTHGLRHVRGQWVLFADADGASRFSDLEKLMLSARRLAASDPQGRGRAVAVGSRAHLVGSEEVVKRSWVRNALMHSFHVLLRLLTPPRTGRIRDTQCGFKLMSRQSLPDIVPYMHSEGWIFDVEMLMLAESAGIEVAEVAVGWHEVGGSKLRVLKDSLGMAWGLLLLRAAWGMGVYRRA